MRTSAHRRQHGVDPARSAQMALVKSKNTKPERIVRQILRDLNARYRGHVISVPGKPDFVLLGKRKVIFVHGCFWHQHQKSSCWRSRIPKTKSEFWVPKLLSNRDRDRKIRRALRKDGWRSFVIWECQTIVRERSNLKRKVELFLRK